MVCPAARCPGPDEAHKPAQKAARSIPKSCQKKHPIFINCNTYFISTARRNARSDSTKSYFSNIVFYSYVYYIIFSFIERAAIIDRCATQQRSQWTPTMQWLSAPQVKPFVHQGLHTAPRRWSNHWQVLLSHAASSESLRFPDGLLDRSLSSCLHTPVSSRVGEFLGKTPDDSTSPLPDETRSSKARDSKEARCRRSQQNT